MSSTPQPAPAPAAAAPSPSPSPRSWTCSLSLLLLALLLVYHFHLDHHLPSSFPRPRLQAIAYPAQPGEDITYGLRLSLSSSTPGSGSGEQGDKDKEKARLRQSWVLELGKIVDDNLRQRVLDAEVGVGVSDSWWYFRVQKGEDSHLLLASLWQANLITRTEAESLLLKGPLSLPPPSSSPSTAQAPAPAPSIHRLPSLATLTFAYYSGAHLGTRFLLGEEKGVVKVVLGVGAVGLVGVVGGRSSRGIGSLRRGGVGGGGEEVVVVRLERGEGGGGGMDAMRFGTAAAAGGVREDRSKVKVRIQVLSVEEWRADQPPSQPNSTLHQPIAKACPSFEFGASPVPSSSSSSSFAASNGPSDREDEDDSEDWLHLAVARMWPGVEEEGEGEEEEEEEGEGG